MIPQMDMDMEAQDAPSSSIKKARILAETLKATREKLGILTAVNIQEEPLSPELLDEFMTDNKIDFGEIDEIEDDDDADATAFVDED